MYDDDAERPSSRLRGRLSEVYFPALLAESQHELAIRLGARATVYEPLFGAAAGMTEIEGRLKELARVYSDSLSPLACARVLVDRLNQGTPANDATNRALMAEIGSPTGDDRISANIVITSNNRRNTDFLHRLLGTVKEADPANTPRFNGGMAS